MVIYDLDVVGVACLPTKAEPPLVVDSNRVLSFAISTEGLQPIARETTQIGKATSSLQDRKLGANAESGDAAPSSFVSESKPSLQSVQAGQKPTLFQHSDNFVGRFFGVLILG